MSRCGEISRIREEDRFCHKCGYPLKVTAHDGEAEELKTFFLDIDSAIMLVNGKEKNNVAAFSLVFDNGKYGLSITYDEIYEATVPKLPIAFHINEKKVYHK